MKQKCLAILCLSLAGAAGAFAQITLNSNASKALGQPQLLPKTSAPNLVEGRELNGPGGMALDNSVTPPVLYVSDSFNNRVMVWKNATGFTNGQPADLIIGQIDQYSTTQGGGTNNSTGLFQPSGLTVSNGNLYVADTGNNRILRFPKPYTQTTGNAFPDQWIGQPSVSSRTKNYTGAISAQGLSLAGFTVGLAFDSNGGLWATDSGNNRVVHYPASVLGCTNCGAMAADTVLGQQNLTSGTTSATALSTTDASAAVIANEFNLPGSLAIDPTGNLYVTDSGAGGFPGRILIFQPPFVSGGSAARIMGVKSPSENFTTQTQIDSTVLNQPGGIFFFPGDNAIGVLDTFDNRILVFPAFASWKGVTTPTSPQAIGYYGQTTYLNLNPNQAASTSVVTPQASNATLAGPGAAVVNSKTNELYVADTFNNRVLALPLVPDGLSPATRVLGQDLFSSSSPNLIEGREFDFTTSASSGGIVADAGIAIDTSGPVPHLYVADTYNNRILGFKDLRTVNPGVRADIVIGQPNFSSAQCNYNSGPGNGGDITQPNQSSLCSPKGLAVDSQGNLYVADSANGRVLRFPSPFSYQGALEPADLVIGQRDFTSQITDPRNFTMKSPYGLAFTGTNGLLVSDEAYNRVLYFKYATGATFRAGTDNGLAALKVFGQPDFTTTTAGSTTDKMNSPHHISTDTNGQLYVADSGNNRLMIFQDPNNAQTPSQGYAAGTNLGGFSGPEGIYVNPSTGEIWVANTSQSTAIRFPQYSTLIFNPAQLGKSIQLPSASLALAQDTYGDLVVADAANRISIFFPQLTGINGANFDSTKLLAPQTIATLYPIDATVKFGANTGVYTDVTTDGSWPTTLADIQVLFNGTPAPLDFVGPGQVNFFVPNGAPVTGTVDVEVVQKSTGQVWGAGQLPLTTVSPGLFLCPGGQTGKVRTPCVLNQDYSLNTQSAPAARGSIISLYMTGLGFVPNAPADGQPTPTSGTLLTGQASVDLVFDAIPTGNAQHQPGDPANFIQFVGLAPGFVGLWQVNVQIPLATPPGTTTMGILINGNIGEPSLSAGYTTVIYVK